MDNFLFICSSKCLTFIVAYQVHNCNNGEMQDHLIGTEKVIFIILKNGSFCSSRQMKKKFKKTSVFSKYKY